MYNSNRYGNYGNYGAMGYAQQPSAQPNGTDKSIDSPYIQQLRKQLADAQALQAQMQGGNGSNMQSFPPNPGPPPETQQLSPQQMQAQLMQNLSPEAQMILRLFDEFSATDGGKKLVAAIGEFNGFCQEKLGKPEESH